MCNAIKKIENLTEVETISKDRAAPDAFHLSMSHKATLRWRENALLRDRESHVDNQVACLHDRKSSLGWKQEVLSVFRRQLKTTIGLSSFKFFIEFHNYKLNSLLSSDISFPVSRIPETRKTSDWLLVSRGKL